MAQLNRRTSDGQIVVNNYGFCVSGEKLSSSYLLSKTGARGIVIRIQAFVGASSLQRDAVASQGTFYLMPSGDTMVGTVLQRLGLKWSVSFSFVVSDSCA